jgi:hypothetical protein
MKIFKITLVVLIVIILSGFILAHLLIPGKVAEIIRAQIHTALDDAEFYRIEVPEVNFDLFFTSMHVPHISITVSDEVFAGIDSENLPQRLIQILLQNLHISSNGLIALARNKENVEFSHLQIETISAMLLSNPDGYKPKERSTSKEAPPNSLKLNNIELTHLELESRPIKDTTIVKWYIGHAGFTGNIDINNNDTSADRIVLSDHSVEFYNMGFFDELYHFSLDSIQYNETAHELLLHNFRMDPRYGKAEFSRRLPKQTERMIVHLNTIAITEFDLNAIINQEYITTPYVQIQTGTIHAFRDRNVPHDETQYKPLFTRLIREAPLMLNIAQIMIADIFRASGGG